MPGTNGNLQRPHLRDRNKRSRSKFLFSWIPTRVPHSLQYRCSDGKEKCEVSPSFIVLYGQNKLGTVRSSSLPPLLSFTFPLVAPAAITRRPCATSVTVTTALGCPGNVRRHERRWRWYRKHWKWCHSKWNDWDRQWWWWCRSCSHSG